MLLTSQLGVGTVALVIAFALLWFGMPNKLGESPRLLRFEAALVLYPAVIMTFFAVGAAALMSIWLGHP